MDTSKRGELTRKRRADRTRSYPSGKKVDITKRSLIWADELQDGAQTLGYLHRVTKELKLCTTKNRAQDHLTDLFHEYPSTYFNGKNIGGRFINRPRRQEKTKDARYQELVYENSDRAIEILKEVGRYRKNSPRYGGPWEHRYMGSCIYNSIKINAREAPNFRFISQHEMMERAGISSLAVRVPFKHPITGEPVKVWSKKYQKLVTPIWMPDGVLGLERTDPDGKKSKALIILQACRSTEGMRCFDFEKKSFLRDYLQQKVFLSTGMYKDFFNVQNAPAIVAHVSARAARIDTMKDIIMEFSPKGCPWMFFQHADGFYDYIKPRPVLDHLFNDEWQRAGFEDKRITEI